MQGANRKLANTASVSLKHALPHVAQLDKDSPEHALWVQISGSNQLANAPTEHYSVPVHTAMSVKKCFPSLVWKNLTDVH